MNDVQLSLTTTNQTRPQQLLRWVTVWPQQICAEKWGAAVPLSVGGAGSPSETMSPGPRPTSVSSGILIHPTVWPQYINVTDRQTGQRSCSIGQTVTCNSHSKMERPFHSCTYLQLASFTCMSAICWQTQTCNN